jgi:hypothetical protein
MNKYKQKCRWCKKKSNHYDWFMFFNNTHDLITIRSICLECQRKFDTILRKK